MSDSPRSYFAWAEGKEAKSQPHPLIDSPSILVGEWSGDTETGRRKLLEIRAEIDKLKGDHRG